jgi:hypothetical protein
MEKQFHYRTYSEKRNILPLRRVVSHLFCCKGRNLGLPLGQTKHSSVLWLKQQRGLKNMQSDSSHRFCISVQINILHYQHRHRNVKGCEGGLASSTSENEVNN